MGVRAFRVAYDGRPFYGFQRQPDVRTVEGAILDACEALGVVDGSNSADETGVRAVPPGYAAAGRTDAGVSALSQTVAFDCPAWCTPRALNAELPASVRAWASADVAPAFHATHDAVRREYVYFCHAPSPPFDDDRALAALERLAGEHDFRDFTADETGTVRTLETDATREGAFLVVRVAAGGFAYTMVRRLVALVRAVGSGAADIRKVDRALSADPLPDPEAVPAAPPEPLVLARVDYPGVAFEVDADAVESLRTVFGERRVAGLVAARVSGFVADSVSEESGRKRS